MIDELLSQGPWLLLLIQGTVCLAVGLVASCALRHRPARAHQFLLMAMLVSVLMPSLYLAAGHYKLGLLPSKPTSPCSTPALGGVLFPAEGGWATNIRLLSDLPIAEIADEPTLPGAEPIGAIPASSAATMQVPWSRIAVTCWSAATAILLLRLVLRFVLGWRVVHAAQPLDSELIRRALDTAKGRLGVSQSIRIRRSGSVRSPVIWCWSREPVLLIQENAFHAEDRADWTGVFCHEVSHWKRRDHLTGLFTEVLTAVFPWHPLLWWAKDRLLRLSEQACDDWVLATGQNDADYAEMLLGLAAERQMAFLPTTIGKGKTMNLRIRRIITESGSDPRVGRRWALVVGVLAVGATVGVAVAQPRPAGPEPMDAPPTKVFKERREIPVREPPGADQQRVAMKRVLERLMKQADEKKEMLREGNDLSEEERQVQQIEFKLLMDQIEQRKNRLEAPGREPRKIGPQESLEPGLETKFDSLRQGHEELEQRAQKLERELEGLRDGQDQEAQELKSQLEQTHAKRAFVEQEMEKLKRAQADDLKHRKLDELKRAQVEVRREKVLRGPAAEEPDREELLQHLRLRAEKMARALKENPDMEAEKAETLRRELEDTRAKIGAIEQESRGLKGKKEPVRVEPKREYRIVKEDAKIEKKAPDGPVAAVKRPAGNLQLEAEVKDLRVQMKELHEQMQQMQKLLEQAVERGPKDRPAK